MKYLRVVLVLILVAVSNPVVADRKIRFWSDRDGSVGAWNGMRFVMNRDGSNPVNLNKLYGAPGPLRFSPDRTKILFSSRSTGNREIFVMDAYNFNLVQLTNHPQSDLGGRWSPDGTKILWCRSKGIAGSEIHVMDADGSNQRKLGDGRTPKWSPDGTKIGFAEFEGFGNPFIMNADGSGRFRLARDMVDARFISWSPDGSKVAFSEYRLGARPRVIFIDGAPVVVEDTLYFIYVIDVDGTNSVNLTVAVGGVDDTVIHIDWSRDGKKIACSSGGDIFVVNADGTNPINLTQHHPSGRDEGPDWSRDGATILFDTDRDGNWEIYSMNADGSNPVNLSNHPAHDKYPYWYTIDFTAVAPQDKLITTWGQIKAVVSGQ